MKIIILYGQINYYSYIPFITLFDSIKHLGSIFFNAVLVKDTGGCWAVIKFYSNRFFSLNIQVCSDLAYQPHCNPERVLL